MCWVMYFMCWVLLSTYVVLGSTQNADTVVYKVAMVPNSLVHQPLVGWETASKQIIAIRDTGDYKSHMA